MSSSDNRNCRRGHLASGIAGILGPATSILVTLYILDRLFGFFMRMDMLGEKIDIMKANSRGIDKKSDDSHNTSRRTKSLITCVLALFSMLTFNADGSIKIYLDFNELSQDSTVEGRWHVAITIVSTLLIYIMISLIFDNIMVGTFSVRDIFDSRIFGFFTSTIFTIRDTEVTVLKLVRVLQWIAYICLYITTVFYMPLEFTVLNTDRNTLIVGGIQIVWFFVAYLLVVVPISAALLYNWNAILKNSQSSIEMSDVDKMANRTVNITTKTRVMFCMWFALFFTFLLFTLSGIIQINSCILRMIRILTRYPLTLQMAILADNKHVCNLYSYLKRRREPVCTVEDSPHV